MTHGRRRGLLLGGTLLLLLGSARPAAAQETASGRDCTLTLQPTDSTRSVSRKVTEQDYVTHLWNGMTWLCTPATMTADSAVQYENRGEVVMVGSVHYRDTIRDLRSRRLTYHERDNRVVAEDSVRLRQLETGSVLRGPRVEFYNAVGGDGPRRTVATGRPRMAIPSPGDTAGEPFRVDSDTAVFVGEEASEAFGNVVIRRGGLTARGGYSRFRIGEGTGFLTRSPTVEGEGFTLGGDTIRVAFEDGELRTVRAVGGGTLQAEDVEVRAARVDVRVEAERAEEMWAYGEGEARAVSAEQEIRGDSLHFDLASGRLREIAAVGGAVAMEVPASGSDGTGADAGGTPDSAAADRDSAASADTASAAAPRLDVERDWIAGDTVRATFAAPDSGTVADSTPEAAPTAGADTTRRAELERLVAAGGARSLYRVRRDSAETGGPDQGERATGVADSASADGGDRLARNYVIGDRITIRFRDGAPLSVHGTRAIGLFLEPVETPDTAAAGGADVDSAAGDTVASDTAARDAASRDSAARDTTARRGGAACADRGGPPRRRRESPRRRPDSAPAHSRRWPV